MAATPTFVRKPGTAKEEFGRLWTRYRWQCITVLLLACVPTLVAAIWYLITQQQMQEMWRDFTEMRRERDIAQAQSAPFINLAAERLPNVPEGDRLKILLERMAIGRRQITTEAIARIQKALDFAKKREIEVGGIFGDNESIMLAAQIRDILAASGFSVRPLQQYMQPKGMVVLDVSVTSVRELDPNLKDAFLEMFSDLRQPPALVVVPEIVSGDPNTPPPDVKIVVGTR